MQVVQAAAARGLGVRNTAAIAALALLAFLSATAAARAQNRISVDSIAARPGQPVTVQIRVDTSTDLTALNADISFAPALCSLIENQAVQPGAGAKLGPPRVVDPEEGPRCPAAGRVSMILVDLVLPEKDGSRIIAAGQQVAAEWTFTVRADATPGEFPLSLAIQAARNGPRQVDLSASAGKLTIGSETTVCGGDCDGNGAVAISELIMGVNIALGSAAVGSCPDFDVDRDRKVGINELVAGVNNALGGCS